MSHESGGDVSVPLETAAVTRVGRVSSDSVRAAIQKRLDSARPASIPADSWRHVRGMYHVNTGRPLWLGANGLNARRVAPLVTAVAAASNDALNVAALPVSDVRRALSALKGTRRPTAGQLADADIALTALYTTYGESMLSGQISPRSVVQSWHIDPQEQKVDSILAQTLRAERLDQAVASLRPLDPGYDGLRHALARYRQLVAHGGWAQVPAGKALARGDSDSVERLKALRDRLRDEELLDSGATTPSATGGRAAYDVNLAAAVARFQSRHGIVVDSILGKETLASLNLPAQYRLGQIAANLERFRWLPRALGSRYILVNVPAFQLQAFDNGKPVLEMKVIVGADYAGRATPVFSDSMEYVVFRPYWSVPDSIAEKEIWTKADRSPGYLARNGYEVVRESGHEHVRQKPGDKNALGLVKFIFPNDFNIYLHDTPEDELFAKDVRAFSHGCIRLEHPAELAQVVLGWPADSVHRQMTEGKNDYRVNLPRKIPVYIVYFTAYVRDGQLYFGNDLYSRDDALVRAVDTGSLPNEELARDVQSLRKLVGG
jgi:murein L,D-transpeptidase YcbB/YkuD